MNARKADDIIIRFALDHTCRSKTDIEIERIRQET